MMILMVLPCFVKGKERKSGGGGGGWNLDQMPFLFSIAKKTWHTSSALAAMAMAVVEVVSVVVVVGGVIMDDND